MTIISLFRTYIHVSISIAALVLNCMDVHAKVPAPKSMWVYPSASGQLFYTLDERGQRIMDFSQCGYRGGTEPLPTVSVLIPPSRRVTVSPGTGDDWVRVQAAIDTVAAMTPDADGWRGMVFLTAGEYQLSNTLSIATSGIVLKGVGDSATGGTRLRATATRQYTLINVSGSGNPTAVSGTTHNLTQKLVPAGARTFQVDATNGLAIGDTVMVKRPSTANWIVAIDMDHLEYPWAEGSKDLYFDRVITHIEDRWVTVDVPLPQTFESIYGGGQIWRYTWSGRIHQVGIEDLYGFSDYTGLTDEDHAWTFIKINKTQNVWVRNITARYFGFSAVSAGDGTKWLTVADAKCLDPISEITGSRRYSFCNEGAELALFLDCYARKGRHDFAFGSTVSGPNVFVHGTSSNPYTDNGPHHRWSVGGLFDNILTTGDELNVRNRGNSGTGHGWTGAYMAVWNSWADTFRVRNPPTARNWLVGSIGAIGSSDMGKLSVGADPPGTYDSSGTDGKGVYPRSLYYAQLQQRLKWPDSEFREVWLGDVDNFYSRTNSGNSVACDATWLAEVKAITKKPTTSLFDYASINTNIAFTFTFERKPDEEIVAASLTLALRSMNGVADDTLWLDTTNGISFASLGWANMPLTGTTVRILEVEPSLLADNKLNVAVGDDCAVDFALLQFQIQKKQPPLYTVSLEPVADAMVRGGIYSNTTYGTESKLEIKEIASTDMHREAYLRWDFSSFSGKLVRADVRLTCTGASQLGNENIVSSVSNATWKETTITYANKPAAGRFFAQWLPDPGQPVTFSVTPQVTAAQFDNRQLSLKISAADDFGGAGNVYYASREYSTASARPQLLLSFENNAPTIGALLDRSVNEDTVAGPFTFIINDDFTAVSALSVGATSSNTNLLPEANIKLGGSDANRTITLTPRTNQNGTTVITLWVNDGALVTSNAFTLTVYPVNDPPVLAAVTNRTIGAGQWLMITNAATDVDLPPQVLSYSLLTSPLGASIGSTSGVLSWRPTVAQAGADHLFSVRVADSDALPLAATNSFVVTVAPLSPPTVRAAHLDNGLFKLSITGESGPDYSVEASTNLTEWVTLFTTNAPPVPFYWMDLTTPLYRQRFYRIRLGP